MKEKQNSTDDQPLGVPPSEFHPHRPDAPIKKRGNVKLAIIVGILIIIIDLCIYFFLLKPSDSDLLKAIEPLKPAVPTTLPTQIPSLIPEEATICTMDAKECSDGSFVGRSGPNCEFKCSDGSVSR